MFYRYSIHKMSDIFDEIPYEKREWWVLASKHASKEEALEWHEAHKHEGYSYKLVSSNRTLKDCFYPRAEVKKRTQTAQLLKSLNYGSY